MYDVYLGGKLLPVTPQSISLSIANKNQTLTLISESEVNLLKDAGLTEISFTMMIPQVKYPFARYESGEFEPADGFLEHLEKLKTEKKPFRFIVSRWLPDGNRLFDTNLSVSLEEYSIKEDAKNGFDLEADVRLKQYRAYGVKTIEVGTEIPSAPVAVDEERETVSDPESSKKSSGSGKKSTKKSTTTTKKTINLTYRKRNESTSTSFVDKVVSDATAKVGRTVKETKKALGIPTSSITFKKRN